MITAPSPGEPGTRSLWLLSMLAASWLCTRPAGAGERFEPPHQNVIILKLPRAQASPDGMLAEARVDPQAAFRLAQAYVQLARQDRDPMWFGRAESLLEPWASSPSAPVPVLILKADILQNRHDFHGAKDFLDRAIAKDPRDPNGRLMRATVCLVQGKFQSALKDCQVLRATGNALAGSVCLAQVLGMTGQLARARELLQQASSVGPRVPAPVRYWILTTSADLAERAEDPERAERELRAAIALDPDREAARVSLADLLVSRGQAADALQVLALARPSVGLLVRRAWAEGTDGRSAKLTIREIQQRFAESAARKDQSHLREEALFALYVRKQPDEAVSLAEANFRVQREPLDVRLVAHAAHAAGDKAALARLDRWIRTVKYEDATIVDDLAGAR